MATSNRVPNKLEQRCRKIAQAAIDEPVMKVTIRGEEYDFCITDITFSPDSFSPEFKGFFPLSAKELEDLNHE